MLLVGCWISPRWVEITRDWSVILMIPSDGFGKKRRLDLNTKLSIGSSILDVFVFTYFWIYFVCGLYVANLRFFSWYVDIVWCVLVFSNDEKPSFLFVIGVGARGTGWGRNYLINICWKRYLQTTRKDKQLIHRSPTYKVLWFLTMK